MAGLIAVAVGCGGVTPVDSAESLDVLAHAEDACLPAAPLGVAVGDSWTVHGIVALDLGEGGDRSSNIELYTTFTITGVDDGGLEIDGGTQQVEHGRVSVQVDLVRAMVTGQWLSTRQESLASTTVAITDLAPAVTLDWECHRRTWLRSSGDGPDGGAEGQRSVEDSVLPSGMEVVVFTVEQDDSDPEEDRVAGRVTGVGYDKQTGRMVLKRTLTYGLQGEETFGESSVETVVDGPVRVPTPPTVITPFLPPPPPPPSLVTPTPR